MLNIVKGHVWWHPRWPSLGAHMYLNNSWTAHAISRRVHCDRWFIDPKIAIQVALKQVATHLRTKCRPKLQNVSINSNPIYDARHRSKHKTVSALKGLRMCLKVSGFEYYSVARWFPRFISVPHQPRKLSIATLADSIPFQLYMLSSEKKSWFHQILSNAIVDSSTKKKFLLI